MNPLGAPILVIRTRTDAASMVETLAAAIRGVDPEIPTYDQSVMETLVERSTVQRRFVMMLLAGFALAALLLAGVGIYGTISQAVAQRTQEIGVRMALGASPVSVVRMVFGEGMRLAAAGMAAGCVAAAALSGLMRSLLFEVAAAGSTGVRRGRRGAGGLCHAGLLRAGAAGHARGPDDRAAAGLTLVTNLSD